MNWLIIYHDDDGHTLDYAVDMLRKNKIVPTVFSTDEFSDISSKSVIDCINNVTHCIILDDRLLIQDKTAFAYGFIGGRDLKIYALKNDWTLAMAKFRDMSLFVRSEDLFSEIENTFDSIRSEYIRKCAKIALFCDGIPFTAESFAYSLAKDNRAISSLFIEAGMSINARTEDEIPLINISKGTPMLNVAIRCEQEDCVKWILKHKGVDIDAISEDRGYSAVMDAVWKGNLELTKLLVSRGANLNFVSNDKQSALVLAVGASKTDICRILLENGADPDIKDVMGMSAYDYARLFKNDEILAMMEKSHKAE